MHVYIYCVRMVCILECIFMYIYIYVVCIYRASLMGRVWNKQHDSPERFLSEVARVIRIFHRILTQPFCER